MEEKLRKKAAWVIHRSYFKHSYITYTARVRCRHHVTSGHGCLGVITFTHFSTSLNSLHYKRDCVPCSLHCVPAWCHHCASCFHDNSFSFLLSTVGSIQWPGGVNSHNLADKAIKRYKTNFPSFYCCARDLCFMRIFNTVKSRPISDKKRIFSKFSLVLAG